MNVIDLLKKDHDAVEELFKSFEKAKEKEDESRLQIAQEICQELTVHATVEEELFYPAVDAKARESDEDTEEKIKEADEEHRLAKMLIAEIQGMDTGDDRFDAKMKVLKDVIEHHVEEEEGELMPKARKLLSSQELEEIGNQVEARQEELKMEPVGAGGRSSAGSRGNRSRRAPATRRRSSSGSRSRSSKSSRGRSSSSRGRKY